MKKSYIFGLFIIISLLSAKNAFASVSISEVMYDPDGSDTNREWVELYNDGGTSVDLSAWKFVEANTNHGLTNYSGGNSIAAGGYAIIALDAATFASEWGSGGAPVFDASFSLVNSGGETLSLKDASGAIVYTLTYDPAIGASDDGNSLQKYDGSWIAADPTAGDSNSDADAEGGVDDTGGGTDDTGGANDDGSQETSSDDFSDEETHVVIRDEWELTMSAPAYGVAGSPVSFETEVKNLYGNTVYPGTYVWNMGDGTTYTQKEPNLSHTYEYPGDYVIMLDYWRPSSFEKELTARLVFTVRSNAVSIQGIPTTSGGLDVELTNKGSSEIDLSGWTVSSGTQVYAFPEHTILLGSKTLRIPARSTGFSGGQALSLSLVAPDKSVVATSSPQSPAKTYSSSSHSTHVSTSIGTTDGSGVGLLGEKALAADADLAGSPVSGKMLWWLSALLLALLGAGSVFYMRHTKTQKGNQASEDFEVELVD